MAPILVFDFETTGLTLHPNAPNDMQPRAIEFGGVYLDPDTADEIERFEFLINPQMEISPEITKITGITNFNLVGQPTWIVWAPKLCDIFNRASASVAHNLPFDKSIIRYENERNGLAGGHVMACPMLPAKQFCTLELYRQAWGKDMTLKTLYAYVVGRALDQQHRGLSDVLALCDIIRKDSLHELMR